MLARETKEDIVKKLLYVAGGIVAILLLVVLLVLYHDFDSPELGARVATAVRNATGVELTAESFQLTPARGLWVSNVTLQGVSGGTAFTVELDELVFEHRLWPLLRGDVVIERVVLQGPRIELVTTPPTGDPGTTPPTGGTPTTPEPGQIPSGDSATETTDDDGSGLSLQVGEIAIVDGMLTAQNQGTGSSFGLTDLDLTLRDLALDPAVGRGLAGFSGQGEISAEEVRIGATSMAVTSGQLDADSGRVAIRDFAVESAAGQVAVQELSVDTTGEMLTYRLSASADAIDPNVLLGIPEQDALGNGTLTVEASGVGVGRDGIDATGSLRIDGGEVPDVGPLARVDGALGTSIVGAGYEPTEVSFSLVDAVLSIAPFALESDLLRIAGNADANLGGPLAGRMVIGVPRGQVQENPGVAANVLDAITNDDDWLNIPVVIGGTLQAPTFGPDGDAITQAVADAGRRAAADVAQRGVERVQEEVREGVSGLLSGRLGGRR